MCKSAINENWSSPHRTGRSGCYGPVGELWPQTHITVTFQYAICGYFKYDSKTTDDWQLYYTPNDSSTTNDPLFHLNGSKPVTTYKLQPHTYITVMLFCAQDKWQQNSGHRRLYYRVNNHFPTKDASFKNTHWGTTYELPSSSYHNVLALHVGYYLKYCTLTICKFLKYM